MHRSTSGVRRACAVGTTIALIGLTTGLGVFGATAAYADDAPVGTAASAPTTGTTTGDSTSTNGTTTSDSTSTDGSTTGSTSGDTTTVDTSGTPAGTGSTATPTPPATPTPAASTPTPASNDNQSGATAVTPKVALAPSTEATITGAAKVGVTLQASADQLTGPYGYAWTVEGDPTVVSTLTSFPVTEAYVGKTITVTITGTDGTATATTTAVTEDVAFATTTSYDAPRVITVAAGTTVNEAFRVAKGSGTVEYALGYADPDSVDPETDTPDSYLPFDSTFDAATATLTGTLISAGTFDFTVIASNGTSTATEYVEVVVNPGQAVGIMASATDRSAQDAFDGTSPTNAWIIEPDGHITTIVFPADIEQDPTITDGGQPTVKQGGSLWVNGSPVDQYGNDTTQYDDEGNAPQPTVTSDHATDQISFDEDSFATKVTFPNASTHVLTVAEDDLSVAFPVTVVPTVAAVAAVSPTVATPKGQLAFTGSDATDALPWGLAMLAAGAGLVGFRAVRRRTQR